MQTNNKQNMIDNAFINQESSSFIIHKYLLCYDSMLNGYICIPESFNTVFIGVFVTNQMMKYTLRLKIPTSYRICIN